MAVRPIRIAAALILVVGMPPVAYAQQPEGFALEQFEPLPAQGVNLLNVSTSRMLSSLAPSVGLSVHYADDALTTVTTDDASRARRLIDHQVTGQITAAIGLFGYLSLGVALPITLSQSGDDLALLGRAGSTVSGVSLGDLRVIPKLRFWDPADTEGVGLHITAPIYLPTGDAERFASDDAVRVQPTLGLDYHHGSGFLIAANVGYHLRPERTSHNYVSGPTVRWAAGLQIPTGTDVIALFATGFGQVQLDDNRDPVDLVGTDDDREFPVEVLGGVRVRPHEDWSLMIGGGGGIGGDVGAPLWRAFASVDFSNAFIEPTPDDGPDVLSDRCPDEVEDLDGFEDDDGCADPDNDLDGILDASDRCPNEAEDIDGFEDDDGCPDDDNDGDGIADLADACPEQAEDIDGFEDTDGCPDDDNDGDGVPDANDDCPDDPEDPDGYLDTDGCPDADNDLDGILDVHDRCPDFEEVYNGLDDDDGCPD